MPILPIIDLLILLGWSFLAAGGAIKAIMVTTSYRPTPFDLGPMDFLLLAGISFLFALTLAARTWVKANEPRLLSRRQAEQTLRVMSSIRNENPGIGVTSAEVGNALNHRREEVAGS